MLDRGELSALPLSSIKKFVSVIGLDQVFYGGYKKIDEDFVFFFFISFPKIFIQPLPNHDNRQHVRTATTHHYLPIPIVQCRLTSIIF